MFKREEMRVLRIAAGMTQKELGQKCGIAEPTIRRYELGSLNPKLQTIQKIANALGVPISEVLEDDFGWWMEKFDAFADNEIERLRRLNFNATPSPEYISLLEAIKNDTATVEDKQRFFAVQEISRMGLSAVLLQTQATILNALYKLNEIGQRIAVERVEELTKIPDYTKK